MAEPNSLFLQFWDIFNSNHYCQWATVRKLQQKKWNRFDLWLPSSVVLGKLQLLKILTWYTHSLSYLVGCWPQAGLVQFPFASLLNHPPSIILNWWPSHIPLTYHSYFSLKLHRFPTFSAFTCILYLFGYRCFPQQKVTFLTIPVSSDQQRVT